MPKFGHGLLRVARLPPCDLRHPDLHATRTRAAETGQHEQRTPPKWWVQGRVRSASRRRRFLLDCGARRATFLSSGLLDGILGSAPQTQLEKPVRFRISISDFLMD